MNTLRWIFFVLLIVVAVTLEMVFLETYQACWIASGISFVLMVVCGAVKAKSLGIICLGAMISLVASGLILFLYEAAAIAG